MKKLIFIAIFAFSMQSIYAQNPNPFKSIGKPAPEFLSLTNGKYPEIFENDTLRKIGSVMFNTRTNKIEYFIETDTIYSEATLQPEIVSRWLSQDPLARKYPSMSPYSGMGNNPILLVDIDGRDIYIFVYASKNTESGAGHTSFAVGQDTKNLTYYSHYRKSDGGGKIVSGLSLSELKGNYEKNNFAHGQTEAPVLVLRIKTSPEIDAKMNKSGKENINSTWTLMTNNCADCTKDAIDKTGLSEGVAFGISTPNEMVEDLYENNKEAFKDGTITTVKGDLQDYLKNEPNSVSNVLFGNEKKKTESTEKPKKK